MPFPGCGVDTTSFVSYGTYSKFYGSGEEQNLANLFASLGMMEDLPTGEQESEKGKLIHLKNRYSYFPLK